MVKYSVFILAFVLYPIVMTQEIKPCPKSPNCVSSVDNQNDSHYLAAILYAISIEDAKARIKELVAEMPRSLLVEETQNYLHFEFRSRVFKFVDSVEFYLDDTNKLIQFSSRANLGYTDFGVNRRRMLELIQNLQQFQ